MWLNNYVNLGRGKVLFICGENVYEPTVWRICYRTVTEIWELFHHSLKSGNAYKHSCGIGLLSECQFFLIEEWSHLPCPCSIL